MKQVLKNGQTIYDFVKSIDYAFHIENEDLSTVKTVKMFFDKRKNKYGILIEKNRSGSKIKMFSTPEKCLDMYSKLCLEMNLRTYIN